MKTKNKILIIVTLVCVLVSSFAISSFAFTESVPIVRFPSASFTAYNIDDYSVKAYSATVRNDSVNTGNRDSGVRSVWSKSGDYCDIRFGSYNALNCYVDDLYFPLLDYGVINDVVINSTVYQTLFGTGINGVIPVSSNDTFFDSFVSLGFYYFDSGDSPSYFTYEFWLESNVDVSLSTLLFSLGYDNTGTSSIIISYISVSTSPEYFGLSDDPASGGVSGFIRFSASSLPIGVNNDLFVRSSVQKLIDAGYDEGYDVSYDEGYTSGQLDGIQIGYDEGYSFGYDDGYLEGYTQGEVDFWQGGYDLGYQEGQISGIEYGREQGYLTGYTEGYDEGSADGQEVGYTNGYNAGYTEGLEDGEEISAPENWFDGIIRAVSGVIDTPLFGSFSIGDLLYIVIGFSLFMWILKIFGGG